MLLGIGIISMNPPGTNTLARYECVSVVILLLFLVVLGPQAEAANDDLGEKIVKEKCTSCHRITGKPMARRTKQAPDLIWAGNKYQQKWLVEWLQDPKQKLYPTGYDFKLKRKGPHVSLSSSEAQSVANFLGTFKDPRVKKGVMKLGTPAQIERGKQLYKEHACQNCHHTPAKSRRGYVGGNSSTSFLKMGERLQADWVYRFNQNPDDFVPDSGAYIPDPPLPDEDIYAITAYMMTFK